jgi:hypothetical protein
MIQDSSMQSSSCPGILYFALVRLWIEHEELYAAAFFSIQPDWNDRKNEWRKRLALEGVHPYNPLTGIMFRRVLSLDGR